MLVKNVENPPLIREQNEEIIAQVNEKFPYLALSPEFQDSFRDILYLLGQD